MSGGDEFGVVITLEPNEPSRASSRRLLDAVSLRASIRHPNLVRAWPLGWADGRLFVDLEVPSYPSLAERLAAAPLEPAECARTLVGVAAGAAALQERGLVPRAVTPEDVLVHPSDGGVLMDLGIPPEFVRPVPGELDVGPVDAPTCVYSLGAILSTALTGVPSNGGAERRGNLTPEVQQVIARATAADPTERYADVAGLTRAAAAALGVRPAPSPAPSNGNRGARRRPQRNGRPNPSAGTARPARRHPASGAPEARRTPRASADRAALLAAHARRALAAAFRRCAELVVALIAFAVAAGERIQGHVSRLPRRAAPAARTARRTADVLRATLASTGRVVARRVRAAGDRRWTPSFAGGGVSWRHVRGSLGRGAPDWLRRGAPVLIAGGAIAASVVAGTAIGGSTDVEEGPSSVARAGMTVQLPPGWEETAPDAAWSAISPALAAGPSKESTAGLVVAKLSSLGVAQRMLDDLQGDRHGGTPVRLGNRYAWRYAELRPRPQLVGSGYAVPTADGAVVFICHAARSEARVRLAECDRAASTLVIRGEGSRPLSALSPSEERLVRAMATLRSSRSEGRARLAAADQPRGQAGAAAALQRDYSHAARSLDGLPPLENGRSLDGVSTALRDAAAAYGSLADAAESDSRSAYREAGQEVILREDDLRRELARASGA